VNAEQGARKVCPRLGGHGALKSSGCSGELDQFARVGQVLHERFEASRTFLFDQGRTASLLRRRTLRRSRDGVSLSKLDLSL